MTEPLSPRRWLEWQWKLKRGVCPEVILEMRTPLSSEATTGSGAPLLSQPLRLCLPVGGGLALAAVVAAVPMVVVAAGGWQQGDSHTSLFCKLFLTACLFRVRAGAAPYGSVTHCLMWQLINRACCCL